MLMRPALGEGGGRAHLNEVVLHEEELQAAHAPQHALGQVAELVVAQLQHLQARLAQEGAVPTCRRSRSW